MMILKIALDFSKKFQSGKILPNLVTLVGLFSSACVGWGKRERMREIVFKVRAE